MRCLRYSSSSVILLEYQASKTFLPEGCCLQDASGRGGLRIGLGKIKTCAAAKLLLARSAATGPNHQTAATEDFKSRAALLLARAATPLIHPFTVTAHSIQLPEMDSADCGARSADWPVNCPTVSSSRAPG